MANIPDNKAANDIATHFDAMVKVMHTEMLEKNPHKQLIAGVDLTSLKGLVHDGDNTQVNARPVGDMAKGKGDITLP